MTDAEMRASARVMIEIVRDMKARASVKSPAGSGFREALFDKAEYTFREDTVERFRAVPAAHSILAERCWFQLLPNGLGLKRLVSDVQFPPWAR
jgi:hypothetical protein